jgi:hypothetical protein
MTAIIWKRWTRALMGAALVSVLTTAAASAQQTVIPNLDQYAKGATDVTNLVLDKNSLGLASGFMDRRDKSQSQVRNIVSRLNGIYVHTFEYDKDWAYDRKSVADLRKQFAGPEWSNIVSSHSNSRDGDTDIWMHVVNGTMQGMMIISAELRDLTFVQIDGQLRPEDLEQLRGNFGIPISPIPPLPPNPPNMKHKDKDGHSHIEAPAIPAIPAVPTISEASPAIPPQDPRPMLTYSGHPSAQ